MITHFYDDASNPAWIAEMRAMESEGELTPAQDPNCEPDELVMDPNTPALLRRQAA